jgi:cytochrome c-type biogenesis protein CcmE
VSYTGILPDLFRVGQSTITTGKMEGGKFVATQVLAKHDATYMPPQVEQAIAKAEKEHRVPRTAQGVGAQ